MKSCVLFITLLLITSVMSWAQLFEKTYQVPGLGLASSHGVFLSDGNLIQTGCLSPSPAQHAILLSKLQASDGDTIWSKIFHAPNMLMSGTQVVETDNHHLIVTANGVDSGNANNYHHVFLLDLDSNGNLLQSATYDNLGGYSGMYSTGMRFFPDHSLITMSVSYDSLGIVIQKHGPGGALLFSKSILPLGTAGLSGGAFFDVIRKGDAYYFVGDCNFDGNSPDLLLMKTDTLGNVLWLKSSFPGTTATLYIVSAQFIQTNDNSISFALGRGVSTSLVRADTSGVINSFITYGNSTTGSSIYQPYLKALHRLPNGDLLFSGITDLQYNVNIGTHVGKPFILHTDSTGTILWCRKYSQAKDYNTVTFTGQSTSSDIWMGGSAYDTIALSPFSSHPLMYLMRVDSNGHVSTTDCGNDTLFALTPATQTQNLYQTNYIEKNAAGLIPFSMTADDLHPHPFGFGLNAGLSIGIQPSVICQAQNATITVNATVNPGSSPQYTFYVNNIMMQSGASASYTTTTLNNGDIIQCEMLSNAPCVAPNVVFSNPLTAAIYPTINATVSISASPGTVVSPGTLITFTASTTNAGPTPYYYWKKNGIHVGGNSPVYLDAAPQDGDSVSCAVSSSTCAPDPTVNSNILITTLHAPAAVDDYTGKAITLSLYPDPVTDYCTVQINQELNGQLRIYDVFGRICYQQMISGRQWSFPFEQVPGYYLLEIVGTTGAVRTSFLKK